MIQEEIDSDCQPILSIESDDICLSIEENEFSLWKTFKHHIPRLLLTILIDVILPFVIYLILRKHFKAVHALLSAGIPPFLMVVVKGFISRTFDALGFLVFIAFAASAIAAVLTHNAIILLLEKSLVNGITSLVFGITLIPFSCCQIRPLAYYFYQDLVPTKRKDIGLPDQIFADDNDDGDDNDYLLHLSHKQEVAQVYEWLYAHCASFRRTCYLITIIWTIGLLCEFLLRLLLILMHLSVDQIFIYGHIMLISMTIILIFLTILCIVHERKQTIKTIRLWKDEHLNF